MSNSVLKLFVTDIIYLLEGSHTIFNNIKFTKIETQGTVTKFSEINGVLNIEITDVTGTLKDMVFKTNFTCPKINDNASNMQGLKTLKNLYNKNLNNLIEIGDIITVIGAIASRVFYIDRFYKTSIISNTLWTNDVLHLYNNHYNKVIHDNLC